MPKISKETVLSEILKDSQAREILVKYNVPCLGCSMAKWEMENLKIGDICRMYGIDIKKLLKELNRQT